MRKDITIPEDSEVSDINGDDELDKCGSHSSIPHPFSSSSSCAQLSTWMT
jgi:hypothetical protein